MLLFHTTKFSMIQNLDPHVNFRQNQSLLLNYWAKYGPWTIHTKYTSHVMIYLINRLYILCNFNLNLLHFLQEKEVTRILQPLVPGMWGITPPLLYTQSQWAFLLVYRTASGSDLTLRWELRHLDPGQNQWKSVNM